MQMSRNVGVNGVKLFLVFLLLVVFVMPPGRAIAVAGTGENGVSLPGDALVIMRYDPLAQPSYVPAPEIVRARSASAPSSFSVQYNPSSCEGSLVAWTPAAKTAFNYAVSIWDALLDTDRTIVIHACYRSDLEYGILGGAMSWSYYREFSGVPYSNTWYPVALANMLAGSDLNGSSEPEIYAEFSSTFDWYYGTDGNTSGKIDFATVVLHELGHGLGFAGSMDVDVRGNWGYGTPYPFIYDRFTQDLNGTALLNTSVYPNPSFALKNVLTGGDVYFNGTYANVANGGSRVELYAPSVWDDGSSYSHLAEIYNGTVNALMTYSLGTDEVQHSPGPVTLGMFQDMGWSLNTATNTAPTLSSLPDQTLAMNTTADNAIDLWAYAEDAETSDQNLSFAFVSSPPANFGVTIDSNRFIDIAPISGFSGQTTVEVQVTDEEGATDTSSFLLTLSNTSPVLSTLPEQILGMGESLAPAIDLWAYAEDAEDTDANLTFIVSNSPSSAFGVSIGNNRYLNIVPVSGFVGQTTVEIQVADSANAVDTASFMVTVNDAPALVDLPDQIVPVGGSVAHAIDLWEYASDLLDTDAELTFSVVDAPSQAGVTIEANRYVNISPSLGFSGIADVVVGVQDTLGFTGTDTFALNVTSANITPTLVVPDIIVPRNTTSVVDLWDYAEDRDDRDAALVFTLTQLSTINVQISVNDEHYLTIVPSTDWTGTVDAILEVQDPDGASVTDTFSVKVVYRLFMPVVMR